jgi:hypothetical protein
MFFYTIMTLFITLIENVNKSRTSAGRLSLNATKEKKVKMMKKVSAKRIRTSSLQTKTRASFQQTSRGENAQTSQ